MKRFELLPLQDADIRYYACFFAPETADRNFQTLLCEVAFEQRMLMVYGKRHPEPRLTAWYGDEGATYSYSANVRDTGENRSQTTTHRKTIRCKH